METPIKIPLWILESALKNEKEETRLALLKVMSSTEKLAKRMEKFPLPNKTTQKKYDAHMELERTWRYAQNKVDFLIKTIDGE